MPPPYFVDDDAAMRYGMLIGHLMSQGVDVHLNADDDGVYTDEFEVTIPWETGGVVVALKVLPPPSITDA